MAGDDDLRTRELRRRLLLARYPRRGVAAFTDENDHNPLVLEDCPVCRGRGTVCTESDGGAALDRCSACEGSGTTGEVVRHFPEAAPETDAAVDALGWTTCPRCGRRFSTMHRDTWTGRRHLTCGQALRLVRA